MVQSSLVHVITFLTASLYSLSKEVCKIKVFCILQFGHLKKYHSHCTNIKTNLFPINLRSYKKYFTHREIFLSIFSGIFPVDRTRYPKNRLNPLKLEEYNIWKMSGDPLNWDRVANGR